MAVILLSSPLQPQTDAKVVTDKKNYIDNWCLLIGRFNVEVYHE